MRHRKGSGERVLLTGETDLREPIEDHLSAAGLTLVHAPDLVAALDRLDADRVDALLLAETDRPPQTVVERLRRAGHALPVVAVVGDTLPAVDVAAVAPADDPEAVVARLDDAVTEHRLDRERTERRRLRAAVADARGAAFDATDSEEAFDALCRTLVDTGAYDLAWVGRHDAATERLEPVAAAGLPLDHLGGVSVAPDADTPASWALETGAVATTETGDRQTLAVPLGDGETVLHVAGCRPWGVSRGERDLLASLGADLGPALDGSTAQEEADGVTVLGDALGHELGNQLDIALTHLELAQERDDGDHFDHVETALERMTELADDARLLARGEVDVEPVDLAAAAKRAWETVDAAGATLDVSRVENTVDADPDLLGLMLENLLRNAVEHGSTGSQNVERSDEDESDHDGPGVNVRVGTTDSGFAVADDGPGIPVDDRERVLEWGYSTDGTGVGLGVVALVAERHGWTVDVLESQAGGARFEFS